MSRHNRERRKRRQLLKGWHCTNPKCGVALDPDSSLAALAAEERLNGPRTSPATVICPLCNTFHFVKDDKTGVRALTPNERFQLYVDIPRAAEWAETHRAPLVAPQIIVAPVEG